MKEGTLNHLDTLALEAQKITYRTISSVFPTVGRTFAREHCQNPARENTSVLSKAIESIEKSMIHAPLGKDFIAMRPIILRLRTGAPCIAFLTYETTGGHIDDVSILGSLTLTGLTGQIALRKWHCYIENDQFVHDPIRVGRHIAVYSRSETIPEWEGNGFGTALLAQSDFVCRDLITRYHPNDLALPAIGFISDSAKGKEMKRANWTSDQTKEIGYIEWHPGHFVKQYR